MAELSGKIAVITGASRGIGKSIALQFAREGAGLLLIDLDSDDSPVVQELLERIKRLKTDAIFKKADITLWEEVKTATNLAYQSFGKIDVLVNNAGGGTDPEQLENLEEQDLDRIVNVNLKGTYLCSKAVVRKMRELGKGAIINISSLAGRQTARLANLPYASAKAGIIGFTRQLARDLGPYGIRVNAIAPGIISTERIERRWLARADEEKIRIIKEIPLGRVGTPEEIAYVAVFLASEKSSYITGATIDVNGGIFMG